MPHWKSGAAAASRAEAQAQAGSGARARSRSVSRAAADFDGCPVSRFHRRTAERRGRLLRRRKMTALRWRGNSAGLSAAAAMVPSSRCRRRRALPSGALDGASDAARISIAVQSGVPFESETRSPPNLGILAFVFFGGVFIRAIPTRLPETARTKPATTAQTREPRPLFFFSFCDVQLELDEAASNYSAVVRFLELSCNFAFLFSISHSRFT